MAKNLFIIDFQSLILLGDMLNRVAENDIFDWSGRSKLIDCISNFILVRPHIGQVIVVTEITSMHMLYRKLWVDFLVSFAFLIYLESSFVNYDLVITSGYWT